MIAVNNRFQLACKKNVLEKGFPNRDGLDCCLATLEKRSKFRSYKDLLSFQEICVGIK